MKNKKNVFGAMILIALVAACTSALAQNIEEDFTGFAGADGNFLVASIGERSFRIDKSSFEGIPFNITEMDGKPVMRIFHQEDIITITQRGNETSIIRFGKPLQGFLEGSQPIVYLTEHYSPDMEIGSPERIKGEKRIAVVAKDAKVQIENSIIVRTDRLKINTRSVLDSENLTGKEIDVVHNRKGFEIFSAFKDLIIDAFDMAVDNVFDRGFSTVPVSTEVFELGSDYKDIIPGMDREGCSKFGFEFLSSPEIGPDAVSQFTKGRGFALHEVSSVDGVFDGSILDAAEFVNTSDEKNITPVIRVMGDGKNMHVATADNMAVFINEVYKLTDSSFIIQIWDKPNVAYDEEDAFSFPQTYADYVIEVSRKIPPEVNIIAGSLSIGEDGFHDGHYRNNSMDYLNVLLKIPEFWESIDYWGSSSYGKDLVQCKEGSASTIEDEKACLLSAYAYRSEMIRINEAGFFPMLMLTKVGYPSPGTKLQEDVILLSSLRDDDDVDGAIIYSADDPTSNWLSGDSLEGYGRDMADQICPDIET